MDFKAPASFLLTFPCPRETVVKLGIDGWGNICLPLEVLAATWPRINNPLKETGKTSPGRTEASNDDAIVLKLRSAFKEDSFRN